jgi:hypothetical protein
MLPAVQQEQLQKPGLAQSVWPKGILEELLLNYT